MNKINKSDNVSRELLEKAMKSMAENLKKEYDMKFYEWDCEDAEARARTMNLCVEAFLSILDWI